MKIYLICWAISFIHFTYSSGQNISFKVKKEWLEEDLKQLKKQISQEYYLNDFFIKGQLYQEKYIPELHPYFEKDEWTSGIIIFENNIYEVPRLKYDITKDLLIYFHITEEQPYTIALTPIYINEFIIHGKRFRYLNNETIKELKPGYYEVKYDRNTKFYVKWEKYFLMNNQMHRMESNIRKSLYLMKNKEMIKIKNSNSLFRAFQEKKKDVKSFMKKNSITFSKDDLTGIIKALEYYDKID